MEVTVTVMTQELEPATEILENESGSVRLPVVGAGEAPHPL